MATALLLLAASPGLASSQETRLSAADEPLRATAGGREVARLRQGAAVRTGAMQGDWREVTLEAWIWGASVRPERRDGHDLVVVPSGGENLRAAPNGAVVARALEGMLLTQVERRGAWVRVRRAGWVRDAALGGATPVSRTQTQPRASPAAAVLERTTSGESGGALLSSPAGDTVARVAPLTGMDVVAREGNWARVRLEGWIWAPSLRAEGDTAGVLQNVSPEILAANPDAFRGRVVQMNVQFIAVERADRIRADFYEGEPFILARAGAQSSYVYIAVPENMLDRVSRVAPLSRMTILARVRTGRSSLTGAAVLELVELSGDG
jgi:hypothetical protein